MRKINPANELAKRNYLAWLRNARGMSPATIDQAAAAIDSFAASTRQADFKTFRREQVISYKEALARQVNPDTGKPLAKATLNSRVKVLRAFFEWLSQEPGYRRTVRFSDAAYFNLTANEARIATAARPQRTPSLEQVLAVLDAMPEETIVQRRDRALIAFILLTGVRDSAAITLRLKHVDLAKGQVNQDAREVHTKRAKTIQTFFFPVGDRPRDIVADWIAELRAVLFGPDDPLFPTTRLDLNAEGRFAPAGVSREAWTTTAPARDVFRKAFAAAGLETFGPHSLRRTLMRLAYDLNLGPRELKAWSQNLGHEGVLTSFTSYGALGLDEQARVMAALEEAPVNDTGPEDTEIMREIAALARRIRRA
ncbi:MAG: tyrosine-type recombinase/integrase [Caulobacter sp.]